MFGHEKEPPVIGIETLEPNGPGPEPTRIRSPVSTLPEKTNSSCGGSMLLLVPVAVGAEAAMLTKAIEKARIEAYTE